jgi:hypothetical protein
MILASILGAFALLNGIGLYALVGATHKTGGCGSFLIIMHFWGFLMHLKFYEAGVAEIILGGRVFSSVAIACIECSFLVLIWILHKTLLIDFGMLYVLG